MRACRQWNWLRSSRVRAARRSAVSDVRNVMLSDIGRAHLYAPMTEEAFVDLPKELHRDGYCGKLNFTLCGLRMVACSCAVELQFEDDGGQHIPSQLAIPRVSRCSN